VKDLVEARRLLADTGESGQPKPVGQEEMVQSPVQAAKEDAQRLIILNGIPEFVTRPDLADRAVFLALQPIPKDECRSDNELAADFKEAHPRILGVLLDAVAHGLGCLPQASRDDLPRMADFAVWARACETAFWETGDFDKAYTKNRNDAIVSVLEADQVASALRLFMEQHNRWEGTASTP
jgi:hypothetical protein